MKRRQTVTCMDGWIVAKVKGKLNGVLQTKVWKPGAAKEDNQRYGQRFTEERRSLKNKVWDLGKIKDRGMLIRRSIIFYLGSLMQEHPLSENLMEDLAN